MIGEKLHGRVRFGRSFFARLAGLAALAWPPFSLPIGWELIKLLQSGLVARSTISLARWLKSAALT